MFMHDARQRTLQVLIMINTNETPQQNTDNAPTFLLKYINIFYLIIVINMRGISTNLTLTL